MRRQYTPYWRTAEDLHSDKGAWWVNFRVGGKRKRYPLGFSDLGFSSPPPAAVEQAAAHKWIEKVNAPIAVNPTAAGMGMAELAALYLSTTVPMLQQDKCPSFTAHEEDNIVRILRHVSDVKSLRVDDWNGTPTTHGVLQRLHFGDKLKWQTVKHTTATMRRFLSFCQEKGAIAAAPAIRGPSRGDVESDTADRRAMTVAERDAFLAWLERGTDGLRKKDYARALRIYTILFFSAMRRSELVRMTLRWIEWDESGSGGWIKFPNRATKTGKKVANQKIRMHPKVAAEIHAQMKERGSIDRDAPLFGRFDYDYLFRKGVAACGMDPDGLTPHHVTRHTCCTLIGNRAKTANEVRSIGRWKDLKMLERYWHEDAMASKDAFARLDEEGRRACGCGATLPADARFCAACGRATERKLQS